MEARVAVSIYIECNKFSKLEDCGSVCLNCFHIASYLTWTGLRLYSEAKNLPSSPQPIVVVKTLASILKQSLILKNLDLIKCSFLHLDILENLITIFSKNLILNIISYKTYFLDLYFST